MILKNFRHQHLHVIGHIKAIDGIIKFIIYSESLLHQGDPLPQFHPTFDSLSTIRKSASTVDA